MIATKLLRAAKAGLVSGQAPFNPYKARKPWPPDFSKLDPKYQFRLERRYRRRSNLKWMPAKWVKGVKLAQWGICSTVFVYGVLYMDWGPDDDDSFGGVSHMLPQKRVSANRVKIRDWLNVQLSSIWTPITEQPSRPAFDTTTTDHAPKTSRVLP
ncbi:MAG: hypothetical protein Q9186_004845 [Xanthomendoza sp. 1 TL-2023]